MDNAEADAAAAAGIRTSKDDGSWPADIRRAVAGGSAAPCTRRGADRAEAPWRPAAARHRASAPAPVRLPRASTTAFSAASQRSVYLKFKRLSYYLLYNTNNKIQIKFQSKTIT